MYLDNKYTYWYNTIITNAKSRTVPPGYMEKHHIIPRSLGGNNTENNLVLLTPKEHFICHLLLTKMTTGNDYYKMCYALNMLTNAKNIGSGRYTPTSKLYDYAKRLHKKAITDSWTPDKRKRHGDKIRKVVTGRKHKPESIEKMQNKEWTQKALETRLQNCLRAAEARKGTTWSSSHYEKSWQRYVSKNSQYFESVLAMHDAGAPVLQIANSLGISWEKANNIIKNKGKIRAIR
jgi:hypothetical protein